MNKKQKLEQEYLKSNKMFKKGFSALIITGALSLLTVAIGLPITASVCSKKIDDFEAGMESQYQEYVDAKEDEYLEELYNKEIDNDLYIAKINDLKDFNAFIKSEGTPAQIAEYDKIISTASTAMTCLMLVPIGSILTVGGVGMGIGINAGRKKDKYDLYVECEENKQLTIEDLDDSEKE